jgi:hypothetical protein
MIGARRFGSYAAGIFALITVASCGDDPMPPYGPYGPLDGGAPDGSDASNVPPDKTPPTITFRAPEADDENVWAGAPIRLLFSEPLAPSSVGPTSVTVDSEFGPVAVRTKLSTDGREIQAVLESPHLAPAHLTATVAKTVTDVAGNAFAGVSWSWSVPLWQKPGQGTATSGAGPLAPAMALGVDQQPIVAWQEPAAGGVGGSVVRAARVVGARWERLGEALNLRTGTAASGPSIVVPYTDDPVVVWQEASNDGKHVYAKQLRDGHWEQLGTGAIDAGGDASAPFAIVGAEDSIVVAWIDDKNKIEVRYWDGSAWKPWMKPWTAAGPIADLALAKTADGIVIAVTVPNDPSNDVLVLRWSEPELGWQTLGAPLDRAVDHAASHPRIAVSPSGLIGVAWRENDGYTDNVYAAYFDEAERSWKTWGTALDVDLDAPAKAPSIGFDAKDAPVVAWTEEHADGARTYVARFIANRWEFPGSGLTREGVRGVAATALAVDRDGNPVVLWEQPAESDAGAASELSVRRYNGGARLRYGLSERVKAPCAFPESDDPNFPRTLTDTRCFADVPRRIPARGVVPYDVNAPLWSDGALKRRFIILPEGATIGFDEKEFWHFPVGTIVVKEFLLEREFGNPATIFPMETRFLLKRCEPGFCRAAWEGYSYQWNDAGTEATLLDNATETVFKTWSFGQKTHRHSYPGRDECRQCHVVVAGGVLGINTGQLNRPFDYGSIVDNQLRAWGNAGMFTEETPDGGADGGAEADSYAHEDVTPGIDAGASDISMADVSIGDATALDGAADGGDGGGGRGAGRFERYEMFFRLPAPYDGANTNYERVRAYFHSNCSHCHRPDGRWPVIDFLYDAPLIADSEPTSNICNQLVPGKAAESRVFIKDSAREGNIPPDFFGTQMPPLGTLIADVRQLPVLEAWINGMKSCP